MLHNSGALIAQAFTTLAQRVHHPALFHRSAGKDRTGILAATILALLGVSKDDIVADYLLTNEVIDGILARIRKMPGFEHAMVPEVGFRTTEFGLSNSQVCFDDRFGGHTEYNKAPSTILESHCSFKT
jgi:hypothetical protein